ncbi:MAG: AarF/ABC1/UbiB kinase family protein [Mycobacterium sp.]|nr:AarF/ABC1/UbiB kinase family protein [Mycobacterium sp.]
MSGDPARAVGPYATGPRKADLEVHAAPLDVIGLREVRRGAAIGLVMSTTIASASLRWLLRGHRERWEDAVAVAVADGFERLGPTFVKLGQLMASTSQVFPHPLAQACLRLLDDVAPVPAASVRAVVEADLGHPVDALFAEFDDAPLASGSVAQVHRCRLPDGREAVVKVQRPGIGEKMLVDLRLAYVMAAIAERWLARVKTANARGVVRDLHAATTVELNSALEAHNQATMRANITAFGDNPMVTAPEIYWEYCGPRVICMERLHGGPIDRTAAVRADRATATVLIRSLVKVWLESVTEHGLFHGDVHAGNLWVLDDGRLAMLDFGIVGELPPAWREVIRNLFCASAIDGDYACVARSMRALGFGAHLDVSDEIMGAQLAMVLQPLLSAPLAELNLNELMDALLDMGQQWDVVGPEELILFGKQLGYFERYLVGLAPGLVLGGDPELLRNIATREVMPTA